MLETLNNQQLKAATLEAKTILCLAGAGTGKTRVLTTRMAHLFKQKRFGTSNMLCLTFTRLAAKEMKDRLKLLIGEQETNKLFCGTFHSFCVKVLREWCHVVDLEANFTIYDEEDRSALLNRIMDDLKVKNVKLNDLIKNMGVWNKAWPDGNMGLVAQEYYWRLKQNNAVDLDLLLHLTNEVLNNDSARDYYHNIYKYVFVDEFQDTSNPQYYIIEQLDPEYLFVVGDDFQAIYGWRGANVQNILNFNSDVMHPEAEVIKLEENYRSTVPIVAAANQLIRHNVSQTEKVLRTEVQGPSIGYYDAQTETNEFAHIGNYLSKQIDEPMPWSEYAVLARTNAQLQRLKVYLDQVKIPAQLVNTGGDVFKRPVVKGILDFIAAANNPSDNIAVEKAFNFPDPRSTSIQLDKWKLEAITNDIPLMDVFDHVGHPGAREFSDLIYAIRDSFRSMTEDAEAIFKGVYEIIGLRDYLAKRGLSNREKDLIEAYHQIHHWHQVQSDLGMPGSYDYFLKWLRTKDIQDNLLQDQQNAVKLLTIHAAKGLEFNTVFIIGLNQGMFPNARLTDPEEERRLMYVAITRAKRHLFLSRSKEKLVWGSKTELALPSQYLEEIGVPWRLAFGPAVGEMEI